MINIIVAMDQKRGIGKDNKIPWHIPEDLRRFHHLTDGHPVIMGRKTFESILTYTKGKPLSNRTNIVITRDPKYKFENVIVCNSLSAAIDAAKRSIKYTVSSIQYEDKKKILNTEYSIPNTDKDEVFIIGGAQIFEQSIKISDRLYLTIIDGDYHADTFFPEYEKEFTNVLKEQAGESGEYKYTFVDLGRSN